MKLFRKAKDGGPKSTVTGYWLIEAKKLFSIALLRFDDGSREEYHDHAFNSWNWVLSGEVEEQLMWWPISQRHRPSWRPVFTPKSRMHRVVSKGTTWVFSIRGPWSKTWREWSPRTREFSVLTHGREVLKR